MELLLLWLWTTIQVIIVAIMGIILIPFVLFWIFCNWIIRKYFFILILLVGLAGCAAPSIIINNAPSKDTVKFTRFKDSKQVIINAIMTESKINLCLPRPLTQSEAILLWKDYKSSGIKGFADYLIQTNPYEKIDSIYIDFVKRIKVRTKILKRRIYER